MSSEDATASRALQEMKAAMNEHEECMATVKELEALLDHKPADPAPWVASVVECLVRLRRALEAHFEDEPQSWLYQEVPLRRPRFASTLKRLTAEHPGLLRAADEVLTLARTMKATERHHMRELNGRAQLLVSRLYRHEAEEREILVDAAMEDTGIGD